MLLSGLRSAPPSGGGGTAGGSSPCGRPPPGGWAQSGVAINAAMDASVLPEAVDDRRINELCYTVARAAYFGDKR